MLLDCPRPHNTAANNYKTFNYNKSVKGKFMGVGKIVQLVAVLAAVVAGLWAAMPEAGMIVAVLGAVGGYFVAADDRQRFIITAIALSIVAGGLGAVPAVGGYVTGVMGSLGNLFAAGAVVVILVGLFEELKP
jgi:hypothetical protein